jgi:hypothetical protein
MCLQTRSARECLSMTVVLQKRLAIRIAKSHQHMHSMPMDGMSSECMEMATVICKT